MLDLKNKTILITGGTGSFGKTFVECLLKNSEAKKIIVLSRDELKQFNMQREFNDDNKLRFFLGDVRDLPRLQRAFRGVDIVIHAAALKQVPMLEYNPFEAVKTNILGSQNVIEAAIDQGVEKVLLVSTDKAAHPVNLYGSTKLCAEKLFISGNAYTSGQTKFACVRYGNVFGSRGSIIDVLKNKQDLSEATLTDERMTRFWITLKQSHELVSFALENMVGGEIVIPKIPSMKVKDIFTYMTPNAKISIIGVRPGEKLHESLLTEQEAMHAIELDEYYLVYPEFYGNKKYCEKYEWIDSSACILKFTSDNNQNWITEEEFYKLLEQ